METEKYDLKAIETIIDDVAKVFSKYFDELNDEYITPKLLKAYFNILKKGGEDSITVKLKVKMSLDRILEIRDELEEQEKG
jgi:hypothetical protein